MKDESEILADLAVRPSDFLPLDSAPESPPVLLPPHDNKSPVELDLSDPSRGTRTKDILFVTGSVVLTAASTCLILLGFWVLGRSGYFETLMVCVFIPLALLVIIGGFIGLTVLGEKYSPKKDVIMWYREMFCESCGYSWKSRRPTPPAKCPSCNSRSVTPLVFHSKR